MKSHLYAWMWNHNVGVLRYLYVSSAASLLTMNSRVMLATDVINLAISLTLQAAIRNQK